MILDGLLTFTGTSNGATGGITSGAQTDSPTTGTQIASNLLDLGVTSGVPTSANGGGARDLAISERALFLSAIVTTAFVGGTSLQLELDGAPDNGSGAPGSYTVMWQSQAIAEAALTGGQICNIDLPRVVPDQVLPRFLRLRFITVGTHTGGAIEAGIVLDEDMQISGPTGLYSGYPAGVTVAN
jgi:hypothetical protein